MNTINDGGPAFPGPDQQEQRENIHEGMSLRDYFAAKAMQGFASTARDLSRASDAHLREEFDFVSRVSYLMADAMLRARGGA